MTGSVDISDLIPQEETEYVNEKGSVPHQVYLSGQMVPEAEAKISICNSAVMSEHCVTDTIRTICSSRFA